MADSLPFTPDQSSHQPSMSFSSPVIERPNKPKPKSHWSKRLSKTFFKVASNPRLIALCVVSGLLFLAGLTVITYVVFANSLATPEALINRKNIGLVFYDRNGQEFYHTGEARDTTLIPMSEIPDNLKQATIAIEDKDFYNHGGFSASSIGRAVLSNVTSGDINGVGGSTITQQLVKNALLTQKKSFIRKFQELVLAIEINRRYSKDQILQLYLTSTYYGSGAYGVNDAAQTYFNKSAKDLDVAQAAMIAGLPQAPSAYSPIDGDPELAKQRQAQVLKVMLKQGYIDQATYDQASVEKLTYNSSSSLSSTSAPHFVEYVRSQLAKEYSEDEMTRSGFRIYTTLDTTLQNTAQSVMAKRIATLGKAGANNGALVAIDPATGQMLAMVGSANYTDESAKGMYNWATEPRQPGSSTKPFMYLASFEDGYTPATILHDQPTNFGGYSPHNATGKNYGDVTVRTALSNSLNIPAVAMLQKIGTDDFIDTLKNFGASSISDDAVKNCGLSVVLGCAELPLTDVTHAYATLADQGEYHDMMTYTKILDKSGNQIYPKQSLFSSSNSDSGKQIVNSGYTYLISDILNDNSARSMLFGSNSPLKLSRQAAVKTGTTDQSRDAWAIGYTPQIVVGVWVGNSANTPMTLAGATGAAPIWHDVMESYLKGKKVEWYDQPSNVVKLLVCKGSESIAENQGDNTFSEYFIKSQLPKGGCNATPTPTPTEEVTPTPTDTPTATPTPSPTVIVTPKPTITVTLTPTPTITPTTGH